MIVYLEEKSRFLEDVDSNRIEEIILREFQRTNQHSVGNSEKSSWRNSMNYMHRIMSDPEIPGSAGVAIEFGIPQSSKRIDFLLTGTNPENRASVVVIELKQWSEVSATRKDAVVKTRLGGASVEALHPSFQAWSYAMLLEDFSEVVQTERIQLSPCAYLHNCSDATTLTSPFYAIHTERAPVFLMDDAAKLRAFIKQHVKHGDSGRALYRIKNGKISPSKNLADTLVSLLEGNREFLMIDDQKLVYEAGLDLAKKSEATDKNVLIVEGGPGTGKSVVAIHLLVELTRSRKVVKYVTKNAAPRAVYESKLTGHWTRSRISNLFTGSGCYFDTESNIFDALIVDEAHRLNKRSGMFQNLGENQVKELIHSSKLTVFFIDEGQRVTLKDIGTKQEIRRWADSLGATVTELTLASQFRCNGSDGYLAWVDHTLGIRETANTTLDGIAYEFEVCESAAELRRKIIEKNRARNKARMVAGYCWDWNSKKQKDAYDICFPEGNFKARWNLATDGNLWILKPESVSEIGCIHTCQGLELDYVGVILGPDWIVRNGEIQTVPTKRSKMDASIKGYKTMAKSNPELARQRADEIIKNTYRTLMTRGQKGCFVYAVDPETNAYLRTASRRTQTEPPISVPVRNPWASLPLRLISNDEPRSGPNAVPVYDLEIAAGDFGSEQFDSECQWAELPEPFQAKPGYFVARVLGESMNRRIPNGSWCLFRSNTQGSRQNKIVLVQLQDFQDAETGARFTVKRYTSSKSITEDSWHHERIVLKPESTQSGFSDIELSPEQAGNLHVVGELVAVLGQT